MINQTLYFPLLSILLVELVLKGFSLWGSAKRNQQTWFICLLIFNTLGILPLIYLIIHKDKKEKKNNGKDKKIKRKLKK